RDLHSFPTHALPISASGDAGLAADASAGVDELRALHHRSEVPLPCGAVGGRASPTSSTSKGGGAPPGGTGGGATGSTSSPRSTRQAQTLNSGIFDTGSRASIVMRFAATRPAQW